MKSAPLAPLRHQGNGTRFTHCFGDTPAAAAGLQRGDLIVQLGSLTFAGKERQRGCVVVKRV